MAFFGMPTPGTDGNLGRNTYEGPGFANLDFSLFKNFKIPQINEQSMLQLRFEFFNMFNRVNFYQPTPTDQHHRRSVVQPRPLTRGRFSSA